MRYAFKAGHADGHSPNGGLVNVDGKLYGTTNTGGTNCIHNGADCGTVFSMTTSGKETVLHSFKGAPKDGQNPDAGVIYVNGKLYGVTTGGGQCGFIEAKVAELPLCSRYPVSETLLHSFGNGTDGVAPLSASLTLTVSCTARRPHRR